MFFTFIHIYFGKWCEILKLNDKLKSTDEIDENNL